MSARRICEVVAFAVILPLVCTKHINTQGLFHPSSGSTQEVKPDATPRMSADPTALLLETGFRHLYELNFRGAREDFANYQMQRPDDPLGKAAESATYLFEEFSDKNVLTSKFFLDDSRLLGGIEGSPPDDRKRAFFDTVHQARELAKKRVKWNPHDVQGLLVLTMADGLESAYDAIIAKEHFAAIQLMHHAEKEANATLAADPSAQDAYVGLGMSNYVIGSLPAYKRTFLWLGGIHGDRQRGIAQMRSAAEHGHYFRPFAKIMLALAYEREGQANNARQLLTELATEFPSNPLFSHELELLDDKVLFLRVNGSGKAN